MKEAQRPKARFVPILLAGAAGTAGASDEGFWNPDTQGAVANTLGQATSAEILDHQERNILNPPRAAVNSLE